MKKPRVFALHMALFFYSMGAQANVDKMNLRAFEAAYLKAIPLTLEEFDRHETFCFYDNSLSADSFYFVIVCFDLNGPVPAVGVGRFNKDIWKYPEAMRDVLKYQMSGLFIDANDAVSKYGNQVLNFRSIDEHLIIQVVSIADLRSGKEGQEVSDYLVVSKKSKVESSIFNDKD